MYPLSAAQDIVTSVGGFKAIGTGALVVLFVISIMRGLLIPSRTVDRMEKETETWKQAYFEEKSQNRELMITAEIVRQILRALPNVESHGESKK